jgi:hypothetical protein
VLTGDRVQDLLGGLVLTLMIEFLDGVRVLPAAYGTAN